MKLRIKTKLSIALFFLFAIILAVGGIGATYILKVGRESKKVLQDNYESIVYAKSMIEALDEISKNEKKGRANFEKQLIRQEKNITEIGEKELTGKIRQDFNKLGNKPDSGKLPELREKLFRLMDLNMAAVQRKHNQVQSTVNKVLVYMCGIITICFVFSFTFIINFPGYIANPIRDLTNSIKQIANRNYSERINFKSNDEFGELALAFNSMAAKLDEYEHSNLAQLMFEKKRIDTIINNMRDPVVGFNEQRLILFANKKALQILNLNEKEIIGKYAPDVALTNDLLRMLMNTQNITQPFKIFADGKECYFNPEYIPIVSDEKSIGDVILLRNITQFQELDQAKTNLIATISHELKTPISSIKLSSKLLEDARIGELNEEQKELITNIKEESERLLKITGEVLNMAQIEMGKIELHFQEVEPIAIVDYAIQALRLQAEQKHLTIKTEIESNVSRVKADMEKSAWVLVNLLSNAIRYSDENKTVEIKVKKQDQFVEFSVRDFGKGIPAQYQEKIFSKFFQLPNSEKGGSGLGLAISKDFIVAQGGSIRMESGPGAGSVFTFVLPCV